MERVFFICKIYGLFGFRQFYTHATSDIFFVGVKALKALNS